MGILRKIIENESFDKQVAFEIMTNHTAKNDPVEELNPLMDYEYGDAKEFYNSTKYLISVNKQGKYRAALEKYFGKF